MDLSSDIRVLIEGLQRELAELRTENTALKQEVSDLRRQLGNSSSNSSKPPSSEGLPSSCAAPDHALALTAIRRGW